VNVELVPTVNVVDAALVIVTRGLTVSTNDCVTDPAELLAVNVSGNVPDTLAPGVPARVAVPLAPAVNVTPLGRVPVRVIVGTGDPVATIGKLNATPAVAVADAALVKRGAPLIVRVNAWVVAPPALVAVNVSAVAVVWGRWKRPKKVSCSTKWGAIMRLLPPFTMANEAYAN
jgi:hypothetical protein